MQYRKLVEQILIASYKSYTYVRDNHPEEMSDYLTRHDSHIPVWCDIDDATKQAAIVYVYKKRKKIELHSDCVQAWVQATAYFLIYDWFYSFADGGADYANESVGDEFEIDRFFDDLDFMSVENLDNAAVRAVLGISDDFTGSF